LAKSADAVVIKNRLRIKVGGTIVHGTGFVNSTGNARFTHPLGNLNRLEMR
jgi:hypothetical protein